MSNSNGHNDSKAPKRDTLKPLHRLVLMFDGTGNKRFNLSNVARMFEAIDDSNPNDYKPLSAVNCEESVLEPERQPVQLVRYIKGVGTGIPGHFSGLGFGYGLSANVIEGYVWLSNNYCEGDEVFVFGFSRGAFSARSLVSLVHRCGGVLKDESISAKSNQNLKENNPVVLKAYDMYQAYVQTGVQTTESDGSVNKASEDAWRDFTNTANNANFRIQYVPIKMLGVWDTVGAVGLPITGSKVVDDHVYPFSRYSRKRYQFHGQGLSCIVENAYHALAIDEHRQHFEPTLWDAATPENKEVKQVWFVGSHCNVGGGADIEKSTDPDDLWLYSYVWMQKHAMKHGLRFYWTYDSPPTQHSSSPGTPVPTRLVSLHPCEDSYDLFLGGYYKWFYNRFYRKAVETISIGAKLHWSVLDRIALADVLTERNHKPIYCRPPTLFGPYGRQFKKVEPDMVEIQIEDQPDLVKKTLWQIDTDDTKETEPPHGLKVNPCGCRNKVDASEKQSGF